MRLQPEHAPDEVRALQLREIGDVLPERQGAGAGETGKGQLKHEAQQGEESPIHGQAARTFIAICPARKG